jgi:hypothetical protein
MTTEARIIAVPIGESRERNSSASARNVAGRSEHLPDIGSVEGVDEVLD